MGEGSACDVCGGSETNLVDGFYYCAECGTQDTNVRETIVEHTALADGTFARFTTAKYSVKIKDGVEMSKEWYKWHAYNFVLNALTERLLVLGAKPSIKMKVLWIWCKFIKKHQNKKQMGLTESSSGIKDKISFLAEETEEQQDDGDVSPPIHMTLRTLAGILYLALNLDESPIQLSHFRRYMKDGRLHLHRTLEYVPKEIDVNMRELKGLGWCVTLNFSPMELAKFIKKFQDLDLDPPLVPDLEQVTDNLLKELCLPKDLRHLVLSLMNYAPVSFLDKTKRNTVLYECECVVMSYIIVALKMCLGLDDDYEFRVSDVVDEINFQENHLKAYTSDLYPEPSERLFSFREWSNYLMFRKHMLCKNYLPTAKECDFLMDDYVFMEHSKKKAKKEVKLSDEVTMDIINKIPECNDLSVIPLSEFEATATPVSSYTNVIAHHLRDMDTRQLLSEDFTQYSIDYAYKDLSLRSSSEETSENVIVGVSKTGKVKKDLIGVHLVSSSCDSTIVYVKKCDNKNWFKTKRPKAKHIVKEDSDHGYDSNSENSPSKLNNNNVIEEESMNDAEDSSSDTNEEDGKDKKLEVFEEEAEGNNIFDDDFLDIDGEDNKLDETINNFGNDLSETMETLRYDDSYYGNNEVEDNKDDIQSHSLTDTDIDAVPKFDPQTFDREETIKKIIVAACSEQRIPVPQKFRPQEPIKRKAAPNTETDASRPKRAKQDEGIKRQNIEKKDQVKEIISAYYKSLNEDVLRTISLQVRSFVENVEQNDRDTSFDQNEAVENHSSIERNDSFNAVTENDDDNNAEEAAKEGDDDNLSQIEDGDKSEYESMIDPVFKGAPAFDEETHYTKQLYLKVKGEIEQSYYEDLNDDEEINALIEEKIKQSRKPVTGVLDSEFDPSDDLPLSHFKKIKDNKKLENLIRNPKELGKFNYWIKHYISQFFKRGTNRKIDHDMKETFPNSFMFVLREGAFVLNCSIWILYKHLTDIEELMLKNIGFKKKVQSFEGTGLVFERRPGVERHERYVKKPLLQRQS